MNEVLIRPDEYQARPRHMPPIFLSTLAVLLLAFGGTLTVALPWNILDLANGPEFQDLSRFQRFVWDLFAVFSFVMLLRWCTVQFLAFRAQLSTSTTPSYDSSARPSVSILVPAYQEAENIESTLRSLVELEYPRVGLVYQKKTRCFSVSQLAERYCSLKDDLFAIEAEGLKRKAQAETR
jgi:hypothetical protein